MTSTGLLLQFSESLPTTKQVLQPDTHLAKLQLYTTVSIATILKVWDKFATCEIDPTSSISRVGDMKVNRPAYRDNIPA